jgi:hypothetical protein
MWASAVKLGKPERLPEFGVQGLLVPRQMGEMRGAGSHLLQVDAIGEQMPKERQVMAEKQPIPKHVKAHLTRTAEELIAESKRLREQAARLKKQAEQIRQAIEGRKK